MHRALIEADHGVLLVGGLGVELRHVFQARHEVGIDCGNAPRLVLPPGFELFVMRATTDGLFAQRLVRSQQELGALDFQVKPPTVHSMILTPQEQGLLRRTPRQARSLVGLVPIEELRALL